MDRQRVVFSQSEKLDYFLKRVIELANNDEAKIREELRADREAFFEKSEKLLADELEAFAKDSRSKAFSEIDHERSKLALERKYELMRIREDFGRDLQNRLIERVKQFTKTNEYKQFLLKIAENIITKIFGDGIIYLSPADMKYAADIKAHLQSVYGKAFDVLEDQSIKLGGLYCSNGKVSVNETLDNRVKAALSEIDLDDLL